MKTFLSLALILAVFFGVFFGYPLLTEGTKSPCKALERRALTLGVRDGGAESVIIAALARQLLQEGKGRIAAEFSRQRNPDIPVSLSCNINYWHSLVDRGWLTGAIQQSFN